MRADAITLDWRDLVAGRVDCANGAAVEIAGWMAPAEDGAAHDYFFLTLAPRCCIGCGPGDPAETIEVFAAVPIETPSGSLKLGGRWRRLPADDPSGWRYQLTDARTIEAAVSRRGFVAAGAAFALVAGHPAPSAAATAPDPKLAEARQVLAGGVTIDIHSHAGGVNRSGTAFSEVAGRMRDGGMNAICLCFSADKPLTAVDQKRLRIYAARRPEPGELYRWSVEAFGRIRDLAQRQKMTLATDRASLTAARGGAPTVIVAAEGADFLEGSLLRLEEAQARHGLRHLQLTHYRPNELGDIQTEAAVHGGLTDFGADVIRACNRLGVVVDIAHGTYELVKRAAAITDKPLVLSHTELSARPPPLSRRIDAAHARAVADTGGVIGIWPPVSSFRDKAAWAAGVARMVDVVGVDHVGLGSDMLGLLVKSVFASYRELPELAAALLAQGFNAAETRQILGGNYARVFAASLG